ncbi:molybdenum cofactor synthesis 3 [Coprinopsis sp. MPI-PUGE-AT-0042]|nr:molybdenum cofactor synthesis 3 [Coprinopsis sp. MPI-PUGE-AT-0042]
MQAHEAQLPLEDYKRYGRQMILDGFGLPGQVKLSKASVAVVGAGGLGCAALPYLASAGIGKIGIFDHDTVEISNLQRQILHNEETLGIYKADSAKQSLERINSGIQVDAIKEAIASQNALDLLTGYDLILDCTDNVPTRYLLSDTAVALGKPLVSGAAQKFDGQLSVFNYGTDGPCYRCIFPVPPKPDNVGSCEELGVIGPVVGTIGNLQAVEAIKILTGMAEDTKPSMLIYNALSSPPFRSIKLRSRRETCPACGPSKDQSSTTIQETDYVQFCGGSRPNWEERGLQPGPSASDRITVENLQEHYQSEKAFELIDVRPTTEFGICSLPNSRHIVLRQLLANPEKFLDPSKDTVVICRLGNDSQLAADALRRAAASANGDEGDRVSAKIVDVIGGLRAWQRVDKSFPDY